MSKVEIKELLVKNKEIDIVATDVIYHEQGPYDFWDLEHIPSKAGVYVIYDITGECLYVGSTPNRFNIKLRIIEHLGSAFFKDFGYKVYCYLTEEDTNDILLLERIFIKALKPPFNNDQNDVTMSVAGKAYIERNKGKRDFPNWTNFNEKDARRAEVPTILVDLKNDIEAVYDPILSELPYIFEGNVSLSSLYKNVKDKLAKASEYDIEFRDFVELIGEVIANDGLSEGQVVELILPNKAFVKYARSNKHKFKKS